ncbi:hypothetical protein Tco_1084867, partial [Tanacetum coccineum]
MRNTKDFEAKHNKVKAKLALLSSSASAPSSFSSKNKGLIAESYDWDEEEVSSDDEETEVKALMTLTNEERICVGKESARNEEQRNNLSSKYRNLVQELNACKEQLLVLKQAKLDLLTMQHVNTEILKKNQNLRLELKELTSITETWLNSFNKVNQCINEQIPTQKKKILEIGQVTEDTSSCGSKDLVFVKSLADTSDMSITSSNLHKSSKAEDSTLPNHDTNEVASNNSQRNTTDPLAIVSNSPASDYDSDDDSSVCSTPLLPLKKLDGVEPGSGLKTVKSILKLKSMFKAETLKGITLNEPSSAPAIGKKSSSAFKANSAPAGKLKYVKVEDDPPLSMEYLVEFWYSTKALENSKVSFSIPTGGIYGEVGLNTFRNVIGAHYLPHSSEYVAPPSIDVVRKWFPTIGYGEEVSTKGTLKKSLLLPRWSLANDIHIDYANIFWEDIILKLKKKQREKGCSLHLISLPANN